MILGTHPCRSLGYAIAIRSNIRRMGMEKIWVVYSGVLGYHIVKARIPNEAIQKLKKKVNEEYKDDLADFAKFVAGLPQTMFTVTEAKIIE